MVLFCRIGYPIPMFAGFCIMFVSTISKCLAFALCMWVVGWALMAMNLELRTHWVRRGGAVAKNGRKESQGFFMGTEAQCG